MALCFTVVFCRGAHISFNWKRYYCLQFSHSPALHADHSHIHAGNVSAYRWISVTGVWPCSGKSPAPIFNPYSEYHSTIWYLQQRNSCKPRNSRLNPLILLQILIFFCPPTFYTLPMLEQWHITPYCIKHVTDTIQKWQLYVLAAARCLGSILKS